MNKKIALVAMTAATAMTASTAQAQTGFRADVHAGWDRVSTHQRTDVGISGATTELNDDGLIYGSEIGYDYDLGGFQFGAYAGIEGASTKECAEVFSEVETCAKAGRNVTLGARIGVRATPAILLYAKGGYSNGRLNIDYIDHATPANSFGLSEDMDGFHIGAGVQMDIMSNLYAKLEYVHTDYEDYSLKDGNATITGGINRDNVMVGVGFRF